MASVYKAKAGSIAQLFAHQDHLDASGLTLVRLHQIGAANASRAVAAVGHPARQPLAGALVRTIGVAGQPLGVFRRSDLLDPLLRRLQITISPLEMVLVDVSDEAVQITVGSDFTYYEMVTEASEHAVLTSTSYRIPKGETQVVQQGVDGTHDVVYEVVYADGQFVSRQAVEEKNDTSVAEISYVGTLVDQASSGDTVKSVVTEKDGSGYLLMKSGDSVHFTGSMKVTCTAYTAGYGGVGTRTATGTTVHVGTVAVDKSVISLGTEMFIVGSSGYTYGNAVAEDTGVRGAAIDLYMNSYQECKQFGRQKNSTVYFLD